MQHFVHHNRDISTVTNKGESSSVPKPSVYVAGMRGIQGNKKKFDLTLSLEMHNNITK